MDRDEILGELSVIYHHLQNAKEHAYDARSAVPIACAIKAVVELRDKIRETPTEVE